MASAEEFDEFYLSSRRVLLLQTFAVTGDLGASTNAVRDAFVAARHHWAKVGRMLRSGGDPESWVRSRAWRIAQARHSARIWHRETSVAPEQAEVLEALHRLPDAQRKVLVLTHLAATPLEQIGREVGLPRPRAEELLQTATAATALALECDSTALRPRLDSLGEVVDTVRLPRPAAIRRSGLRRRRHHAVLGSIGTVVVALVAGIFVLAPGSAGTEAPEPLITKRMLLTPADAAPLAAGQQANGRQKTRPQPTGQQASGQQPVAQQPAAGWQTVETTDNTEGDGLNTMCQTASFADADGLGALVRTFATTGKRPRRLVQTVEVSSTPGAAHQAYGTTVSWYAGCTVQPVRLLDAFQVTGLGDEAILLRMQTPPELSTSYAVAIARSGALTVSTVLSVPKASVPSVARTTQVLEAAVARLCDSPVAGRCVLEPDPVATAVPPSGEAPGTLASVDLPAIARVTRPWVGTDPAAAAGQSPAATTCDRTDFAQAGVAMPLTRTYVVPRAGLPERFGITETVGEFPTARAATRFTQAVERRMLACPDKELASTVGEQLTGRATASPTPTTYALWRLSNQINDREDKVSYWTGVVRSGRYVGQVTFTPVDRYDIDRATFLTLLERAGQRLGELKTSGAAPASPR